MKAPVLINWSFCIIGIMKGDGVWSLCECSLNWINENLEKGSTILEFGSGYGTMDLTENYTVYSVEHDRGFVGLDPKSNYIYAPLQSNLWYNQERVFKGLPEEYDLMIIDGPNGNRNNILLYADRLNWDIPVIVDDVHWQTGTKMAKYIEKKFNKELSIVECKNGTKSFGILI